MENPNWKYIGNCIKRARKRIGVNRSEAAQWLNISNRELFKIENGKYKIPDEMLVRIFHAGIYFYENTQL